MKITWLSSALLITASSTAFGFGIPKESGFSGYIEPIAGAGYFQSQRATNDDNRKTTDLNNAGESGGRAFGGILWELGYTLESKNTYFYAGIPVENLAEGQFQLEVGAKHQFQNRTLLGFALIPEIPIIPAEVWKDPFVTGQDRERTDNDTRALKISADNILGSWWSAKYYLGKQSVDEEKSGQSLLSSPAYQLTTQDLDDLKRSGTFHRLEGSYSQWFSRTFMLKPGLTYTRGDTEGAANAFHQGGFQLTMLNFRSQKVVTANIYASHASYDQNNAVFGKTRSDTKYGAFFAIAFQEPFALKNTRIDWFNVVGRTDSNINFYDEKLAITSLGFVYNF